MGCMIWSPEGLHILYHCCIWPPLWCFPGTQPSALPAWNNGDFVYSWSLISSQPKAPCSSPLPCLPASHLLLAKSQPKMKKWSYMPTFCICLPYKQLSPMARHPMGGNPLPLDELGSLELLYEFSPGRPLSPWEWFFENNQKNHCTWSVATCHLRCVPWPVIMIWAARRGSYLNIVTLEWGLTMTNRKVGGFNLSSVALHKTPTFTFKFYLNL